MTKNILLLGMFSIELIAKILQNTVLPGGSAHAEMMPKGRSLSMFLKGESYIHSAVLLLLFHEQNSIRIVFIKRAEYDGVHSGQIAFPGGRAEPEDADFWQTAVRETMEETGINQPVNFLGSLSDLYVPPSGYLIHPFVGYVSERPEYKPDSHEVTEVFDEDLTWFNTAEAKDEIHYKSGHKSGIAPCFKSKNHIIWGATAMILNEFLLLLHQNDFFNSK
ncbi:putative Nudix hydrolase NudL [anaerobic digester metagenome]